MIVCSVNLTKDQIFHLKGHHIPPSPLSLFLFLQFSRETLANTYSAYIDNFLNARDAVRTAKEAKPAFHKFLEVSVRH